MQHEMQHEIKKALYLQGFKQWSIRDLNRMITYYIEETHSAKT